MHPNDALDRRKLAKEHRGLGLCNITKCCTEVCPENIKITDNGIIPMKERVVDAKYDPVFFRSRRRRKEKQPEFSQGAELPGSRRATITLRVTRTCGAVWSARRPVKPEDAGSNPVRSAVG